MPSFQRAQTQGAAPSLTPFSDPDIRRVVEAAPPDRPLLGFTHGFEPVYAPADRHVWVAAEPVGGVTSFLRLLAAQHLRHDGTLTVITDAPWDWAWVKEFLPPDRFVPTSDLDRVAHVIESTVDLARDRHRDPEIDLRSTFSRYELGATDTEPLSPLWRRHVLVLDRCDSLVRRLRRQHRHAVDALGDVLTLGPPVDVLVHAGFGTWPMRPLFDGAPCELATRVLIERRPGGIRRRLLRQVTPRGRALVGIDPDPDAVATPTQLAHMARGDASDHVAEIVALCHIHGAPAAACKACEEAEARYEAEAAADNAAWMAVYERSPESAEGDL